MWRGFYLPRFAENWGILAPGDAPFLVRSAALPAFKLARRQSGHSRTSRNFAIVVRSRKPSRTKADYVEAGTSPHDRYPWLAQAHARHPCRAGRQKPKSTSGIRKASRPNGRRRLSNRRRGRSICRSGPEPPSAMSGSDGLSRKRRSSVRMERGGAISGLVPLGWGPCCPLDPIPVLRGCKSHILREPPCQGWYVQSELRNE